MYFSRANCMYTESRKAKLRSYRKMLTNERTETSSYETYVYFF